MKNKLTDRLFNLLHYGVEGAEDSTARRKVLLGNFGALVASASAFIFDLLFLYSGLPSAKLAFYSHLPIYPLFGLVFWLNRQHLYMYANWLLVACAMGIVLGPMYLAFGTHLDHHHYFIMYAAVPIIFFPSNQKFSIAFVFLLNAGLFVMFEIVGLAPAADILSMDETTVNLLKTMLSSMVILTLAIFYWIYDAFVERGERRLEQRVIERTAQLVQANKVKDSFLATMSHEIRTPLGGLLGMMELLSLSSLNPDQRHRLETAQLSGKNLLRIVNDILDWSKIEAGKMELAQHQASIGAMLNIVASTYEQLAADKGITLSINIDPHLSHEHIFDPLRMSQILNNFTSNAVKFTQHGSVKISAQSLENSNGYETVRFSVKDSGVGIDKEQQSKLFHHYEQASADTARMYGGTGLGLAICRRLADLMDGTLSVESTLGVGSTFYFTINIPVADGTPLVDATASSAETETTSQEQDGTEGPLTVGGCPLAVLIVDDHPLNRMLLKQQLGMLGVQVAAAESGSPALKLWQNSHFDIIITDCHMPEMDGYELTEKIRAMEQQMDKKRIPIIAWTANVLSDEVERCQVAGMDDLFTKPTEMADLRAMLVKWMNRK